MEHAPFQLDLFASPDEKQISANESTHAVAIADRIVPYRLRRSRRRTLSLSIDQRGLTVGAPMRETLAAIEAFIRKNEGWVARKLDAWRASRRAERFHVEEGVRLPVLGGMLEIRLASGGGYAVWEEPFPSSVTLYLRAPSEAERILEKALHERARSIFAERLTFYAEKLGVKVPPFSISNARTRWGSCNLKTGIRLNGRLLHFPLRLVDYVVVHELAHLREMNHGQRFWAIVGGALPDWRARRSELKEAAARLPQA
jgi:predicted metal-dependent hydrolase